MPRRARSSNAGQGGNDQLPPPPEGRGYRLRSRAVLGIGPSMDHRVASPVVISEARRQGGERSRGRRAVFQEVVDTAPTLDEVIIDEELLEENHQDVVRGQAPRVSESSGVSSLARFRMRVNMLLAFPLAQLDSRAVSSRISTANSLSLQIDEFLQRDNISEDEMTECSMLMTSLLDWMDQAQRAPIATVSTNGEVPRGEARPSVEESLAGVFSPRTNQFSTPLQTPHLPSTSRHTATYLSLRTDSHKAVKFSKIPKFGGQAADWPIHLRRLNTKVFQDPDASAAEKFVEFYDSLPSNLQVLVAQFANDEEPDFRKAVAIVDEQLADPSYGENQLEQLVSSFSKLPYRAKSSDWTRFLELVNACLAILGQRLEESRKHLWLIRLVDKLPDREAFVFRQSESSFSLEGLRVFTRKQLMVCSRTLESEAVGRPPEKKFRSIFPVAGVSAACLFCGLAHSVDDCNLSPKDIRDKASSLRICFYCLKDPFSPAHVRLCRPKAKCSKCPPESPLRHHSKLHLFYCRDPPRGQSSAVVGAISSQTAYLPSIMVRAASVRGHTSVVCRAVFDSQNAIQTVISQRLVEELGLAIEEGPPLWIQLFMSTEPIRCSGRWVRLSVQSLEEGTPTILVAFVLPFLQQTADYLIRPEVLESCQGKGIIISVPHGPIDLSIGSTEYEITFFCPERVMIEERVVARNSKLGWFLAGDDVVCPSEVESFPISYVNTSQELPGLLKSIFYDPWLDAQNDPLAKEWEQAYSSSLLREGKEKRVVASLPWLNQARPDDNRRQAEFRLNSLIRSLKKKNMFDSYHDQLMELVTAGYAERVPDRDLKAQSYYVAHFGVVSLKSSTTKHRIVFDASASSPGRKSLNQCLSKGFSPPADLVGILCTWRIKPYVCVTDIQKAFLQIKVSQEDRDWLRFLWISKEGKIETFRMSSVLFGATSSPFILHAALQSLLAPFKTVMKVYMDDLLVVGSSEEELVKNVNEVRNSLSEGSFCLHKWSTPHSLECNFIDESSKMPSSFLGIRWDPKSDSLGFQFPSEQVSTVTRRQILSAISRVFDPLGLLAPYIVKLRNLSRIISVSEKDFDLPLSLELQTKAEKLLAELPLLRSFSKTRWLGIGSSPFEILGFCDASKLAYGCAVYLRQGNEERGQLLFARVKLSNPKWCDTLEDLSCPKLELVGMLTLALSVQRCVSVLNSIGLSPSSIRLFSDSLINLARLKNHVNNLPVFEGVRVHNILKATPPGSLWLHVPGKLNPADLLSRGCDLKVLLAEVNWWTCPSFPEAGEVLKNEKSLRVINPMNVCSSTSGKVLSFEDFEARLKTSSIEGWKLLQNEIFSRVVHPWCNKGVLSAEIQALCAGFRVFICKEDGLVRVDKRLSESSLPFGQKFPILLGKHPIVKEYFTKRHVSSGHQGREVLLMDLRESFHVVGAYRLASAIVFGCSYCRRERARPFAPSVAPLPKQRLEEACFPFQHVGIDLFGPIPNVCGRKVYGFIFSCMTSRAIHLEVICSKSTKSVLQALVRFCARRGTPTTIFSDNEKAFIQADKFQKYICEVLRAKGPEHALLKAIDWSFNPPLAPFWGGFYERMIGIVKRVLKGLRGTSRVGLEQLQTLLTQVESIVNDRPLAKGETGVITPNHLLLQRRATSCPFLPTAPNMAVSDLSLAMEGMQDRIQRFWKAWRFHYVGQLRGFHSAAGRRVPSIGEPVLIVDNQRARDHWLEAEIAELVPGQDGKSRVAVVRFPDGTTKVRAVHHLIPLESTITSRSR